MKIIVTERKVIANVTERVVKVVISNQRGPQGIPSPPIDITDYTTTDIAEGTNLYCPCEG